MKKMIRICTKIQISSKSKGTSLNETNEQKVRNNNTKAGSEVWKKSQNEKKKEQVSKQ